MSEDLTSASVKDARVVRYALAIESAQEDCDEAIARIKASFARMGDRDA